MIPFLIGLVIFCVVAYIVYLLVNFVIGLTGIPQPLGTAIMAILGLILLLLFLDHVGLCSTGMTRWR